jgi:Pyruvate/2-oxoacid:ferredoxin oxidoreductase delta subunit
MSGTGNSYRLARFIAEEAEKTGYQVILKSTKQANPIREIQEGKNNFFALTFPTHGFTMPWEILKFVCRLPSKKSNLAVSIATRGSLRAGKIFIPGISGSGTYITALLLALKGYRVKGILSQNMPSNWSTIYPAQKTRSLKEIIGRARKRVDRFTNDILQGKSDWINFNNLYELIFGFLLMPISVAYLFIGRFFHAKLFFANNNCNTCSICQKNCPYHAIRLLGKRKPMPYWTYRCESCMRCTKICPENAIEIGHSWGVILFYIGTLPFSVYFLKLIGNGQHVLPWLNGTSAKEIIDLLFWYPAIFLPYFIFQLLLRIPPIHWFFTHTSMTHLKFWGRYKEPETNLRKLG